MIDDFRPVRPPKPASEAPTPTLPAEQPPAKEPAFEPPETAAAHDTPPIELELPAAAPRKNFGHKLRPRLHWPPGKREYLALAALLVVAGGSAALFVSLHRPAPKPVAIVTKPKPVASAPKPTTVPSDLTGLPVDPSVNQRPVTAVMIENSLEARPQSGLSQAGVVFEALAEGGITRFMALYQDTQPSNVGPVRSARPYYVQWALGFDAAYAHVGGSPLALQDISSWGVHDLNQFYNGSYYHRISSRAAPHNVYTSLAELNQLEASKGITGSNFTPWPRKADAPAKQPNASSIDLTLSWADYNVHYDYVAATNSYNRSEGGQPHIDANGNVQISPKVVVAMVIPEQNGALDSTGAYYSDYAVIGSGTAYVFQDGTVTQGQWSKTGNNAPLTFTDSNGQPLKFNAGQTWLTAVKSASAVSYK